MTAVLIIALALVALAVIRWVISKALGIPARSPNLDRVIRQSRETAQQERAERAAWFQKGQDQ